MSALIDIPFVTARRTIEIVREELTKLMSEHRLLFGNEALTVIDRENLLSQGGEGNAPD